jgi:zinc protease
LLALPAFAAPPKVQQIVSPAGIEIWFVQEKGVPVVALEAAWRGGAASEPEGREGLATLLMALLDEGAGPYDSGDFQIRLEEQAIELGFSASRDTLSASLKTLSQNRTEAFRLLGLAVSEPRLDQEAIDRMRVQLLARIEAASTDPDAMVAKRWFAAAFGAHPCGRPTEGTAEGLAAIGRDDLAAFLGRRLARDNLVVALVGDIEAEEAGALVDAAFARLPETSEPIAVVQVKPKALVETIVVDFDIPQSAMLFGVAGLSRQDPDYYAAYLMNYVLGGNGLSSRLFAEVREKRGLAYSVGTYLLPLDYCPLFFGQVASRNDQAGATLDLIRAELRRARDKGLSAQELKRAKDYVIGAFPLETTDNSRIAQRLVGMQLEYLGNDYMERYADIIGRVTLADVGRVAARLLDVDKLNVVVVGRPVGIND